MSSKKNLLTGDRPTGKLHLGHYVGSLKARVDLQSNYNCFIMIADAQALTDHAKEPDLVRAHILEVALDYLSVGIDPSQVTIFIQSKIPALFELTAYYLNLVTWNRLKHNPTVKQEIQQKGWSEEVPAGFMVYPISQAADITAFKAEIVPVGADQIPMLEQTTEVVRKFNTLYQTDVLVEPKASVPKFARLPGTDGKAKMGKSLKNAIYLSDSPDEILQKVKRMYTDPNHLRVEDPGQVEGNPVFIYLDQFASDLEKVAGMKAHYQRGGLGDSIVKKYLAEELLAFLEPIRLKREAFAKDPQAIWEMLKEGTAKANEVASNTLAEVRAAMGINYF